MKTPPMSRLIPESFLWTTLPAFPLVCLPGRAAEPAKTSASAVRPFVDK